MANVLDRAPLDAQVKFAKRVSTFELRSSNGSEQCTLLFGERVDNDRNAVHTPTDIAAQALLEEIVQLLPVTVVSDLGIDLVNADRVVSVRKLGLASREFMHLVQDLPSRLVEGVEGIEGAGDDTLMADVTAPSFQYHLEVHMIQSWVVSIKLCGDIQAAEMEFSRAAPENFMAIEFARATRRGADSGLERKLAYFLHFMDFLNAQDPIMSIENFGPDGTMSLQAQENFLKEVIAADPKRRDDWRNSLAAVLEVRYSHGAGISQLRLPANYQAVRDAREKHRDHQEPYTEDMVRNLSAAVRYFDALTPPVSISQFGPAGPESIDFHREFKQKMLAERPERGGRWLLALEKHLGIEFPGPAPQIERTAGQRKIDSVFKAFSNHIAGRDDPIPLNSFGPDGTLSIQQQMLTLDRLVAEDPAQRGRWKGAVMAKLEIPKTKVTAGKQKTDGEFRKFLRHIAARVEPIEIEAFGPDGTLPIQDQEALLNQIIDEDPVGRRLWRNAVGVNLEDFGPDGAIGRDAQLNYIDTYSTDASIRKVIKREFDIAPPETAG